MVTAACALGIEMNAGPTSNTARERRIRAFLLERVPVR
jgi:hypothetical protein